MDLRQLGYFVAVAEEVPRLAAETGDLASLVELAREGLGAAILPRSAVEDGGLTGVPLTRPRLRRQTVLAWNSTTTSPAARVFLALAELHMPTRSDRPASDRRRQSR
jgi:DNA-binding transcriptional LysR family regulator